MDLPHKKSIIRVFSQSNIPIGSGFLLANSLALTCAHVIEDAVGRSISTSESSEVEVLLDFPLLAPGEFCPKLRARVVFFHLLGKQDFAVIKIEDSLPAGAEPASLAINIGTGHPFSVFGFPGGFPDGVWSDGVIIGQDGSGLYQVEDTNQTGYFIQPGFSGGAILDVKLGKVVGIIILADQSSNRAGFFLPLARIFSIWGANDPQTVNSLSLSQLPDNDTKVKEYCQQIAREIEENAKIEDWQVESFIPEHARFLPVNARPYKPESLRGEPENLIAQLHQIERAIVLGEPGAGKTVALERFAWELARKQSPDIPILIHLTELMGDSLIERVREIIAASPILEIESNDQVNHFLNSHPGYILLDGLNEVLEENRTTLVKEILRLKNDFPKFRLVVTSRVQDETWRRLQENHNRFETLLIQPMNLADIQYYLQQDLGEVNFREFWGSTDSNLRELIRTPLLLKLAKELALHKNKNFKMPENRGELYDTFLATRFMIDKIEDFSDQAKMYAALEKLALSIQVNRPKRVTGEYVYDILGDDKLIKKLRLRGFLIGDFQSIQFPHQTFQEFFTARAIRNNFESYLQYAGDKEWVEVFIFLSGLIDCPDVLIKAIYEQNVWLAWWCIIEGKNINQETKELVESRSAGLVNSPDVNSRRAVAEVLANISLERVIPQLISLVKDDDAETNSIARKGLKKLAAGVIPSVFAELYHPQLSFSQRVKLGEVLGETGDPRPGVIVAATNIPSIDWVDVPEGSLYFDNQPPCLVPSFQVSRYLVTNSQYQAFLDASDGFSCNLWWTTAAEKYRHFSRWVPRRFQESDFSLPNHPAIYVSWFDAVAFCAWLSSKLGYDVSLPKESEWLRIAYADQQIPKIDQENFWRVSAHTFDTGINKTSPVGMFFDSGSPFGALDPIGNVFCWCRTKWREDIGDVEDNSLEGDSPRVMRGSSFTHTLDVHRLGDFPYGRHFFTGFRIVKSEVKHA